MSTGTLSPVFTTESLTDICNLPSHIEWLAIAPKDQPELIEKLAESLDGKPAAILTPDDSTHDLTSLKLQSAIEKAVSSGSVTQVVLVGSTRSEQELPSNEDDTLPQDVNGIASRLIAGAASQSSCNQRAQECFQQEITQFLSSTPIQSLSSSKSIGVCGLLYRDCDDVFVLFDSDTNQFSPLATTI